MSAAAEVLEHARKDYLAAEWSLYLVARRLGINPGDVLTGDDPEASRIYDLWFREVLKAERDVRRACARLRIDPQVELGRLDRIVEERINPSLRQPQRHVHWQRANVGDDEQPHAGGFFDYIRSLPSNIVNAFRNVASAPKVIAEFEKETAGSTISGLFVCREPIQSGVDLAVRILPGTSFPRDLTLYHVWLELHYTNGAAYRVEKNEIVEVQKIPDSQPPRGERRFVSATRVYTTAEFFANAEKAADGKLWLYDPVSANCQWFAIWCIEGNQMRLTPETREFILQVQVPSYVKSGAQWFMKGVTTVANLGRRAFLNADGEFVEAAAAQPVVVAPPPPPAPPPHGRNSLNWEWSDPFPVGGEPPVLRYYSPQDDRVMPDGVTARTILPTMNFAMVRYPEYYMARWEPQLLHDWQRLDSICGLFHGYAAPTTWQTLPQSPHWRRLDDYAVIHNLPLLQVIRQNVVRWLPEAIQDEAAEFARLLRLERAQNQRAARRGVQRRGREEE